ncbi:MAG: hypothetical protein M1414_02350 [Candidatus Thermoplasmatota archaeon]|jgi:hypothetical protein|nr:hypothetical protein [Candidatus Thermoplasmatota archaeon]MCL5987728.1 hypothetical protein [Candidatus Thermoplasmatota archaeon]
MPMNDRKKVDSIIAKRRQSSNLRNIPDILIPLWQIKMRERFGINVDREIARYIVIATHETGTWKKQRAMRKIEKLLMDRGMDLETSQRLARNVIDTSVGGVASEE